MKPKPIGIVGGAGPLAGAALLERVISLSGSAYGCYRDADFPQIILLSFPFSEMLSQKPDVVQLRNELSDCLNQLRNNGAAVLAIACNTLHVFLDEQGDYFDLIHLPRALKTEIPPSEIPLVLCTSTSRQRTLHQQFFPCEYPDVHTQWQIDQIIDHVLKGTEPQAILQELRTILETQTAQTIVLGCTELSLFSKHLLPCSKVILDPLDIVAKKLLEMSFSKKGGNDVTTD